MTCPPKRLLLAACATLALAGCTTEMTTVDQVDRCLDVCPGATTLPGIDVSKWQGDIDWDLVAGAGIEFAFIRVSDGLNYPDGKFAFNWSEAQRVGIVRGAYQFFRPNLDPVAQADLVINALGGAMTPGDLPPVIDVEASGGLSKTGVANAVWAWINRIESVLGVSPIIYTSPGLWSSYVDSSAFSAYTLWLAHYTTNCPRMPTGWTQWAFWQYSDSGTLPGINTNSVDLNHFNGTYADLQALTWGSTGTGPQCGDGSCDSGEDAQSCPADCATGGCAPIPAAGRTVEDNEDCLEWGGDMQYWRTEADGHGGGLHWTHTVSSVAYNDVRWNLTFDQGGYYKLEVYTDAVWAESEQAKYQVHHDGDTTVVEVDQTQTDGWTEVGVFAFAGGTGQYVKLEDLTGEPGYTDTRLVVDGLRLTPVADPTVCQTIPLAGRILDEDGPCVSWEGNMVYWRSESEGYGNSLRWTHTVSSQVYNAVEFDLDFDADGPYVVEVYLPAGWGESEQARYQIFHDGQTTEVVLDQTAASGWVELGTFDFAAGGGQTLRLADLTGEPGWTDTRLVVDAIRVTPAPGTGGGQPYDNPIDPPAGGDDIVTSMACNAGGSAPPPLWLALPLLLFLLRRRRAA